MTRHKGKKLSMTDQEDESPEFMRIDYKTNPSQTFDSTSETMDTISRLKQDNRNLWRIIEEKELLLIEKERNSTLLSKENEKLTENYNLIVSNIVEKDTIMDTLDKIKTEISELKIKNNVKRPQHDIVSYAEITKHKCILKTKENVESLTILPKTNQLTTQTQKDLKNNVTIESGFGCSILNIHKETLSKNKSNLKMHHHHPGPPCPQMKKMKILSLAYLKDRNSRKEKGNGPPLPTQRGMIF
ncbi:hypothetical protein JTB14_029355 [Gonioctena quinquepunctata]|nr:hypothetical protein JTB14_029355 [Gonioctena quinquepunctata]